MSRWFRMYADSMRNPKVARLSDRHYRLWVNLLSVAAENDGVIPPLADLKHVLNARLDHLSTGVERLISEGLIDLLGDGYAPHNWSKRQYKSDTSTPRVQEHRAKRNVSETPPEAETEAETEKAVPKGTDARQIREALQTVLSEEQADALTAHRKGLGAKLTPRAAVLLAKRLSECPNPGAAADMMIEKGWRNIKPDWVARESNPQIIPFNRQRGAQNGVREATDILRDTAAQLRAEGSSGLGDGAMRHDARFLPRPG